MLVLILSGVFIAIVVISLFRKKKTVNNNHQGGGFGGGETKDNKDGKFKNDLEE